MTSDERVVWEFPSPGLKIYRGNEGHAPGYLNYPDGFDVDVFYDWKDALGKKS